jgi:hypothetical protein
MLLCDTGWREAMVGTVSLYDAEGSRQHTIYIGATPEYGKAQFLERLEREIGRTKALYPQATYVGIADGAASNWQFLTRHTSEQVLDFYHATGYLGALFLYLVSEVSGISSSLILPNATVSLPALVLQCDKDTLGHPQLSEYLLQLTTPAGF